MNSGGIKCWGGNSNGQLGIGSVSTSRNRPETVVGLGSGVDSAMEDAG